MHKAAAFVYLHVNSKLDGKKKENLPRTHIHNLTKQARTRPAPPPPALSGTSLNIHHSGCSESAVNAASHSRESLKPTLSSALPPYPLSLSFSDTHTHTYTPTHSLLAAAAHKDKPMCGNTRRHRRWRQQAHGRMHETVRRFLRGRRRTDFVFVRTSVFTGSQCRELSGVVFQETGCLFVWVLFWWWALAAFVPQGLRVLPSAVAVRLCPCRWACWRVSA